MTLVDETLDRAHRLWFGRLVGWLFRTTGDLQLAEDSVAAAFLAAVTAWRAEGVPHSPEAWLRVAARNQALSALRRQSRLTYVDPHTFDDQEAYDDVPSTLDDRLMLLFVCAHPSLDRRIHAPLMLQAVLGVDAARIASVFLVPPSTMGQRLARAKAKIRDAGIRYEVAQGDQYAGRLSSVLQAVYAAYGVADPVGAVQDARDSDLRSEALRLARLLTELLPDEPETWGLFALLLHTESRRPARIVDGTFIPLSLQNVRLWSAPQRELADECLVRASTLGRIGRFQLEAAISAIHSSRADGLSTDWRSIVVLYFGLLDLAPSVGATIGAAGALIETGQANEALALLRRLPAAAVRDHQPYWVCLGRVLTATGQHAEAVTAGRRAVGLTSDPALRRYLISTSHADPHDVRAE